MTDEKVKVYIDWDEKYPVYDVWTEKPVFSGSYAAEVTPEFLERYTKAVAEYEDVQQILKQLVGHSK